MNRKKREQLILDAAIRVFSRRGYSKTSVSEIIHEARVARGTFYLYFKSKKDLFAALTERFMQNILRDVVKINAFNTNPQLDLLDQFRSLSSDLITTVTRNRLLLKMILIDSSGLDKEFSSKLNLFYDQLAGIIRHNLQANIQAGLFRNCQTEIVARCLIGSVKEMIALWITRDDFDLETTIRGTIQFLINGLVPAASIVGKQPTTEEQKPIISPDLDNLH